MAASGLAHPLLLSTIFHMDQITVAGMTIETKYVFFTWLGMAILLVAGIVLRKNISLVPGKFQLFFEALVDGLEKFVLNNSVRRRDGVSFPFLRPSSFMCLP